MTESYVDPTTGEIKVPPEGGDPGDFSDPGEPGKGLAEQTAPAPPALVALLGEMRDRTEMDPEEISRAIIQRILDATTADEVLAVPDVRGAREILGDPVLVHGIKLNESDYGGGAGVYMIVECSDPAMGDTFVVSTGSPHCMAQLYKLHELEALPAKVKFAQSQKATRRGFFPMRIEPA